MFLASVTAMIVLAGGLFVALERPDWVPVVGGGAGEEPVLIFLVGSRGGVESVKQAVDPARIVAESPDAIALAEGRMVATTADAASAPLMAAGWGDREIELFVVAKNDGLDRKARSGKGGGSDDPRFGRLMELMNKPTLSRGEALFVMQAMNDGVM
ncbi:MAG: hypothetical protein ACQGVK_08955 [Myxococcota bacterium]